MFLTGPSVLQIAVFTHNRKVNQGSLPSSLLGILAVGRNASGVIFPDQIGAA